MSITYYIAKELQCQHCHTVFKNDAQIDLSNKVSTNAGIVTIQEGQEMSITLEDISSDYFQINAPNNSQVRCVEIWPCPNCRKQNFAEIVFDLNTNKAVVASIKSISLNPNYLDSIHYLSERIDEWAEYFTEVPVFPSYEQHLSLKPTPEEIKNFREFLKRLQEEKKE